MTLHIITMPQPACKRFLCCSDSTHIVQPIIVLLFATWTLHKVFLTARVYYFATMYRIPVLVGRLNNDAELLRLG